MSYQPKYIGCTYCGKPYDEPKFALYCDTCRLKVHAKLPDIPKITKEENKKFIHHKYRKEVEYDK